MNYLRMKKKLIQYLISGLFLSLTLAGSVAGQTGLSATESARLAEKTFLFTDREIYCVNENILFSAYNQSPPPLRRSQWSTVLYVELITPKGEPVSAGKFIYQEDGTSGSLPVPSWALTGIYYLRAYTHWMRNYPTSLYFCKAIKIINPFRAELLRPSGEKEMTDERTGSPKKMADLFSVVAEKHAYRKRDTARLEIRMKVPSGKAEKITVSVIPAGTENQLLPIIEKPVHSGFSNDFIPETRGLSISGKIVSKPDSIPIPYTLVGLTVFKHNPESRNILTNEEGRFFFDLSNLQGNYDTFLSVKAPNDTVNPVILVDNDFSSQKAELPFVIFEQSPGQRELYQKLSIRSQIGASYKRQQQEQTARSFSSDSGFYGKPDLILKLDDYVKLSSVKDYIYELIPQVGLRHRGKKNVLKVLGNASDLAVYDPLVMMDMVPVFDVDRVLAVNPDKIERIEVVSQPYVRGSVIFGGIISFFSKKADLAGIDLPSAGRFINYSMLTPMPAPVLPQPPADRRIPEIGNCLYWNPSLNPDPLKPARISFSTGDNEGKFIVLVRSLDQSGEQIVAKTEIIIE